MPYYFKLRPATLIHSDGLFMLPPDYYYYINGHQGCWGGRRQGNQDIFAQFKSAEHVFGKCHHVFFFWCLNYRGRGGVFLVSIFFLASFYLPGSTVWLGFQSSSDYVLQSLYLMCKGKHHKSQKHSSVFSNGSLNHSEGEKSWHLARRRPRAIYRSFRFFWLLAHFSSFQLCSKPVGDGDIQPFSSKVQSVPFLGSPMCPVQHTTWQRQAPISKTRSFPL